MTPEIVRRVTATGSALTQETQLRPAILQERLLAQWAEGHH